MSNVLVDTSAWIEFFNHPKSSCAEVLELLLGEGKVCTTGLIMVEVISGARTQSEFERLHRDFSALERVDPPATLWEEMLESRWLLKNRGVSGISIPDLLVVHVALAHQKMILTLDQDFKRIRPILNFNLLEVS